MKIYELLDSKDKFCSEYYALDFYGVFVPPKCSTAVRWSLVGAAIKCYDEDAEEILDYLLFHSHVNSLWEITKWEEAHGLARDYDY